MFAPQSAAAYAKVGVETHVSEANPHQLVVMLFDGALLAINSAAISLAQGDVVAKGRGITKAIEIITYGLKASLDSEAGGELAGRLAALYDYMSSRLFFANANNDPAALNEVASLLGELKDAWEKMGQGNTQATGLNAMSTLQLFEQMRGLTDQMVTAARNQDWDRLCELESIVASMRDWLQVNDQPANASQTLNETERERKASLIKQMLADDREIRRHTEPWMESVRQLLASGRRTRNLKAAYGSTP